MNEWVQRQVRGEGCAATESRTGGIPKERADGRAVAARDVERETPTGRNNDGGRKSGNGFISADRFIVAQPRRNRPAKAAPKRIGAPAGEVHTASGKPGGFSGGASRNRGRRRRRGSAGRNCHDSWARGPGRRAAIRESWARCGDRSWGSYGSWACCGGRSSGNCESWARGQSCDRGRRDSSERRETRRNSGRGR